MAGVSPGYGGRVGSPGDAGTGRAGSRRKDVQRDTGVDVRPGEDTGGRSLSDDEGEVSVSAAGRRV